MITKLAEIDEFLQNHNKYRENSLNLIASENKGSKTVRDYLSSVLSNRYGCYETADPANREYPGNKYIHNFEMELQELVGDIFKAKYVDLRPIGGHISGAATVLGLLDPGDLLFEVNLRDWGHGLVGPMRSVPHFAQTIRVDDIPFDENHMVDMDKLTQMIDEQNPKLIIFGSSGMLFPEPIREVRKIADKKGIILAMDSSHVNGLIAAGVFPNPLEEGVDVMFGSTHKSFPGPEGGFILTNNKDMHLKIGDKMANALVTSHHIYRLPALAAAMLEIKQYGKAYGEQVIKNSKALGKAMDELGFKVEAAEKGYSETHLILVDVFEHGGSKKVCKELEKADIFVSSDFDGPDHEIRIGTAEATRRGMKEEQMSTAAEFIKRIVMDKEDASSVIKDISSFMKNYSRCEYSF